MLRKHLIVTSLALYVLNVFVYLLLLTDAGSAVTLPGGDEKHLNFMKRVDSGDIKLPEVIRYVNGHSTKRAPNENALLQMEARSLKSLVKSISSKGKLLKSLTTGTAAKGMNYVQKVKDRYGKKILNAKDKMIGAIARTKSVFSKVRNRKWINFTVAAAGTIWKIMPNQTKINVQNQLFQYAVGGAEDIYKGMVNSNLDESELIDDFEIEEIIGAEEDGGPAQFGSVSEFEEIGTSDKATVSNCCCQGKKSNQKLEISLNDFSENSLVSDNGQSDVDQQRNSLIEDAKNFEQEVNKITVVKKSAADDNGDLNKEHETEGDSVAKRKLVADVKAKKRKTFHKRVKENIEHHNDYIKESKRTADAQVNEHDINDLPPVLLGMPHTLAMEMFTKAGLTSFGRLCEDLNKPTVSCVSLQGVRIGAVASIITLKLMCPVCDIKILSAVGSSSIDGTKGWNFILEDTPSLGYFITSAFNTYMGHDSFYDEGKNRYTLVCPDMEKPIADQECVWNVLTHV